MKKRIIGWILSFCFLNPIQAAEDDVYSFSWLDPDKEIYVLQNRKYRKDGRVYLSAGGGITTSGPFVDAFALQFRGGYYFHENFGVEFLYSSNSGEENNNAAAVRNDGGTGSIPFRRITNSYFGAMLMWSPFYAKFNMFNKIVYVDWFLGLGYGQLNETNNTEEFLSGTSVGALSTTDDHAGILWDTGLKFWLSQNWDIRVDLTVFHYQANQVTGTTVNSSRLLNTEDTWYSNWDVVFSLGYNF